MQSMHFPLIERQWWMKGSVVSKHALNKLKFLFHMWRSWQQQHLIVTMSQLLSKRPSTTGSFVNFWMPLVLIPFFSYCHPFSFSVPIPHTCSIICWYHSSWPPFWPFILMTIIPLITTYPKSIFYNLHTCSIPFHLSSTPCSIHCSLDHFLDSYTHYPYSKPTPPFNQFKKNPFYILAQQVYK